MRLPTQPRARSVPPARRALHFALLALSLGATPALATRWTVDIGGSGDFTTIQAAIDQQAIEFRDTILVMPGEYAETIFLPDVSQPLFLIGALGAAVTRANSVALVGQQFSYDDTISVAGMTFSQAVSIFEGAERWSLHGCVFLGPVTAGTGGAASGANLSDCDFFGRTSIYGYSVTAGGGRRFEHLRFHGAPLSVQGGGIGPMYFRSCQFEGPADTLVYARGDDAPYFESCRFSGARMGILFGENGPPSSTGTYAVAHCEFIDLSDFGIALDAVPNLPYFYSSSEVGVRDSRFERCGTAIRWVNALPLGNMGAWLVRDTILASIGNAVEIGPHTGSVVDCIVEGSGGHGVEFLHLLPPDVAVYIGTVSGTTFRHNAGDALRLVNTATVSPASPYWHYSVANCTFAENGGAGLRADWPCWEVEGCTSFGNGDDGFALTTTLSGTPNRLQSNTSVLNQGDGFRLTGPAHPSDSLHFVRNNLAGMNTGAGFRMPAYPFGSFAFNDAWNNYLGQYVGAWGSADSNLTVNPRFCDLGAGDLGLERGSPCGPGGLYGLIGALPESCPNTLGVEPAAGVGIAFAVRPSVARGSVEFVPPAGAGEGEVELFDLAGRVVWRATLGPATGAIRWRGQGEAGRVRAGLYWARFTRGDERTTRRLVWLE